MEKRGREGDGAAGETLWIIGGPSCSGKSCLIASGRIAEHTDLEPGAPVLFPADVLDGLEPRRGSYFH